MAVNKINGFRAPYRSETFRNISNAHTGRNGVVSMSGEVTQDLTDITIPPFTFIQEGMLVEKTDTHLTPIPSLEAPFYLVVSAPTSADIDDLIFTFAKSPSDVVSNEVIIAAWDGNEWTRQPFLSFDGVLDDINQGNIDFERVGPFSGLLTTVPSDYENSPGVLVDKTGLRRSLTEIASFPVVADDPDYNRIDRVVYRRPLDDENRIGVRKLLVGGTFDTAPATTADTQAFDTSLVRNKVKTVIGSDNTAHIFTSSGYGGVYSISYKKISSDRTTVLVAETQIQTGLSDTAFDVVIDSANQFYLTWSAGGNILWRAFSSVGVALTAAVTIDAQSGECLNPKIAVDPYDSRTYVVYQSLVAPSQYQIFFTTVDTGGTPVTSPLNLTNDASNNIVPSLFVTDDYHVYVAWENATLGRITYRKFDDIGVAIDAAVNVSGAVNRIGYGTLVDGAKDPKIFVTDNKNLVVAFRQDKGGVVYGLSFYEGETSTAFMIDLTSPSEDIGEYDLSIDPVYNTYQVVAANASAANYVKIRERGVDFTLTLAAFPAQSVSTVQDKLGSIFTHVSSNTGVTFSSYQAGVAIAYIGAIASLVGTLSTISLANDEFLVDASLVTPAIGDQVVLSGSGSGNNGTKSIIDVTLISFNAVDDRYIVKVGTAFAAPENPVLATVGDFQAPDGNETRFIKNTAESQAVAYSLDELPTDVLLSRIVLPGPIILNYPSPGALLGAGANTLVPHGSSVSMSWDGSDFIVSSGLKIHDLVNNYSYVVAAGTYPMIEGEAIYVELDGSNFSVTPQVTLIQNLPWSNPIQVLGMIKDGEFNPVLLSVGGMGQLDVGESIIFGEDLHDVIRTRLGITSETVYESYTSVIGMNAADSYPTAISQTNIMAGQNKHIRLVRGEVQWVNPTPDTLEILSDTYLQIPGLPEARNHIAAQTLLLDTDGKAAYVSINRTAGPGATLTVNVAPMSSIAMGRDTIILFRRVGNDVVIEPTGLSLQQGKRTLVGYARPADERVIHPVRVVDLTTTVLPTGPSVTIDGVTLVNGDKVLFANPSINGIFQVRGIGSSALWNQISSFNYSTAPSEGELVRVQDGTDYLQTTWQFDSSSRWRPIEGASVIKEPTGFPVRTDSTLSFNDGTRTFTITPNPTYFDYFIKGKPYRKNSAQSVVIPNADGMHYIYFDGDTLSTTQTFSDDILREYAFVATVYWSVSADEGILIGDERHSLTMDAATHAYLHRTFGAQVRGGLSLGNFTIVGTGAANADATASVSNGSVIDEDLEHDVVHSATPSADFEQVLSTVAELPVFYRAGVNGYWEKDVATQYPVKQGTSRIQWNQYTLGSWGTVDASGDSRYVAMWVFATNNINEPIIAVLGQNEWALLSDAQANETYEALLLGDLPTLEMKVMYRLIFETSSLFANTPKAALRDVRDLRSAIDTGAAQYSPSDHGLLSGLSDQDHPASAITANVTNFLGTLGASDDDVQKALDTIDRYFRSLQLKEHPSNKKRVTLTGADASKTDGTLIGQAVSIFLMEFDGAEIDFSTGNVYKADGVTPLGNNFTPAVITANYYKWYSVSLVPDVLSATNRFTMKVLIEPGNGDDIGPSTAERAVFTGTVKIGQVSVQESSGTIADIYQSAIVQLGVGSGGGGGGDGITYDAIVTDDPGYKHFTTTQDAINDVSTGANILIAKLEDVSTQINTFNKKINFYFASPECGWRKDNSTFNEQLISFGSVPTSGTWRIECGGLETSDLAYNANAAAVQAAIQSAFSSLGLGAATVTGNYSSGFTVAAAMTGVPAFLSKHQGTDEIQKIAFSAVPVAGAFTLTVAGNNTTSIPYNVTAPQLEVILEATAGVSDVDVTGNFTDGFIIRFRGANGKAPVGLITVFANTLGVTITPTMVLAGKYQANNLLDGTTLVAIGSIYQISGAPQSSVNMMLITENETNFQGFGRVELFEEGLSFGSTTGHRIELNFVNVIRPYLGTVYRPGVTFFAAGTRGTEQRAVLTVGIKGDYQSLSTAYSAAQPGDKIIVAQDTVITSTLTLDKDVEIEFINEAKIIPGPLFFMTSILILGGFVKTKNLTLRVNGNGCINAIRFTGAGGHHTNIGVELDGATVVNAYSLSAGSDILYVDGWIRINNASITNVVDNASGLKSHNINIRDKDNGILHSLTTSYPVQEVPTGSIDGINDTFTMSQTPMSEAAIIVMVDGIPRIKDTHWNLVGANTVVFTAGNIPSLGQDVTVWYLTNSLSVVPSSGRAAPFDVYEANVLASSAVTKINFNSGATVTETSPGEIDVDVTGGGGGSNWEVEYHQLTGGEITAKQFNLVQTPTAPTRVMVDLLGGSSQRYSADFTISGNVFNFNGLGLDGLLVTGDYLRLAYFW